MNNQQAFDQSARHLMTTKSPSALTTGQCRYRSGESRCAIGALIPDELYDTQMDAINNTSVSNIIEKFPTIKEIFFGVDTFLLAQLQAVHDSIPAERRKNKGNAIADFTEDERMSMRGHLAKIAAEHKLDMSVLKEAA